MVLPLIFSALAPSVLAGTGMSATLASALGAGLGGVIQTGDLEKGILTGLWPSLVDRLPRCLPGEQGPPQRL